MESFDPKALQEVRESRLLLNKLDRWIFSLIEPYLGNRILEIGCGAGNLLPHLLHKECVIGIDIAEEVIETLKMRYSGCRNLYFYHCDAAQRDMRILKDHHIDTIVSINVFEHIEDETQALKNCYELLDSRGRLILIIPAHTTLFGEMDRSIGHYRRYTKGEMRKKLFELGFSVVFQKYINMLGAIGWYVNGKVLKKRVPPRDQLRLFNMLVPIVLLVENKSNPLFGLSLLSIAEKR